MTRNLANNVGSSGFLPSRIIAHEKLSQLLTPKGSFEDAHVTQQKKPPKVTFNDYVDIILPFLTTYLPTTRLTFNSAIGQGRIHIWRQIFWGYFWPTYLPTLIKCFTT